MHVLYHKLKTAVENHISHTVNILLLQILQIKVDRLEHLVHLKDLRIEDLTKHLERYKAHNS